MSSDGDAVIRSFRVLIDVSSCNYLPSTLANDHSAPGSAMKGEGRRSHHSRPVLLV